MDAELPAFLAAVALLTMTPGADTALVVRSALTRGRAAALATVAGINAGLLVHALASAIGVAAVIRTSATAYSVLRYAGAAYLLYLAAVSLRAARAARSRPDEPVAPEGRLRTHFVRGLLNNVLNPKPAVFYLAVLPQFIAPGEPVVPASLALASLHIAIGLAWLGTFALAVTRLRAWFTRPAVRARLELATAAVLGGLGVRVALGR